MSKAGGQPKAPPDRAESTALTEVADDLYALLPEDFTSARNARAKEATSAGNQELAKGIRALRRPTTSAWLLNLLVRAHGAELASFLGLGASLRQAQESLAGDDLKQLSRQRHQVISALVQQARGLAADAGHRVSEDVERELEASLDAALADSAAAEAVRSGRLLRPLQVNGFDPVDLTGATALPEYDAAPTRHQSPDARRPDHAEKAQRNRETQQREARHRETELREAERRKAEQQRKARIEAAELTVHRAEAEAGQRQAELADRDAALNTARQHHEQTADRVAELQHELEQARTAEAEAASGVRQHQQARDEAAQRERAAEQALTSAEAALQNALRRTDVRA